MKPIKALALSLALVFAPAAFAQKDAYVQMRDEMAQRYAGLSLRSSIEKASPSSVCELYRVSDTRIARAAWEECLDVRRNLTVMFFGTAHAAFNLLLTRTELATTKYARWVSETGSKTDAADFDQSLGAYRDFLGWFMESARYAKTLPLTETQHQAVDDYVNAYVVLTFDWYTRPSKDHTDWAKRAQDAGVKLVRALQPLDAQKRLKDLPTVAEYQKRRKEQAR